MDTFTPPFILIRDDGWAMEFDDLAALYAAVSEAKICVEKYHIAYLTLWRGGDDLRIYGDGDGVGEHKHINHWIVRDDRGKIVTSEDIRTAAPPWRYKAKWARRGDLQSQYASRGLAIPYTGKRRRHRGSYYRLPQTLNVMRSISAFETDERYDIRPNGKIKPVPNAWDDIGRASYYDRNWKRNRKTQWKMK